VTSVGRYAIGIFAVAQTIGPNSPIAIENSGDLTSIGTGPSSRVYGIRALDYTTNGSIVINNSGDITVAGDSSDGIFARTFGASSPIWITNTGGINSTGDDGIEAITSGANSAISIENAADITAVDDALRGSTGGDDSGVTIINRGKLTVDLDLFADGTIFATSLGARSPITVINYGTVTNGSDSAIYAFTFGLDSPVLVENSGTLRVVGCMGPASSPSATPGQPSTTCRVA
jgi:hypothetical protein